MTVTADALQVWIIAVEEGSVASPAWVAWAEREIKSTRPIPRWLSDLWYASDPGAALPPLYAGLRSLAAPGADTRFQDPTALRLGMMWLRHERGAVPLEQLLARAGALIDAANYSSPSRDALQAAILNDIEAGFLSSDGRPKVVCRASPWSVVEVARLFARHAALAREGLVEILGLSGADAAPVTPTLALDWDRIAPDLPTRTTVRLHPRLGDAPATASKMGEPIAWPADERWPRCNAHDEPLVPVLQLTRVDVPELPWPEGAARFQMLWCPRDHDHVGPSTSAWWRPDADGPWAATPTPGDDAYERYVPRPCVLRPERIEERPSVFDLGDERVQELDARIREVAGAELARFGIPEQTSLYQDHCSVASGTKALGFVGWIQDPDVPVCACGRAMQHLVTIHSAEATGLMLGDMGAVYVFTCVTCPERPLATRLQCC